MRRIVVVLCFVGAVATGIARGAEPMVGVGAPVDWKAIRSVEGWSDDYRFRVTENQPVSSELLLLDAPLLSFPDCTAFTAAEPASLMDEYLEHAAVLERTEAATGAIIDGGGAIMGTGWIVRTGERGLVVTNHHVANKGLMYPVDEATWEMIPGVHWRFTTSPDALRPGASNTYEVTSIVFGGSPDFDMAVLAISNTAADGTVGLPSALRVSAADPGVDQTTTMFDGGQVVVVGYAVRPDIADTKLANCYFQRRYGREWSSIGNTAGVVAGAPVLFSHSATAIEGYSGAAVVDVETGEVLGVHAGDRSSSGSMADQLAIRNEAWRAAMLCERVPGLCQ